VRAHGAHDRALDARGLRARRDEHRQHVGLGLTIDYGPYGWLDDFDPHWTPNTTDAQGRRYRYAQQPAVAQWNLVRLAEACCRCSPARAARGGARPLRRRVHGRVRGDDRGEVRRRRRPRRRRGRAGAPREGLRAAQQGEVDHTLFFRALGELAEVPADDEAAIAALGDVFYDAAKRDAGREALAAWLRRWHAAVTAGSAFDARRAAMHAVNPRYVLRNYLAQQAIDAAEGGDHTLVHTLLDVMRRPYDDQPEHAGFAARRPEWARHRAGCSMLSCSS
jgi:uncharacterized protein YdiU (UPF0061 family)